MKRLRFASLLLLFSLVLVSQGLAYSWTYNTTFNFYLRGFSDTSQDPPTPINWPLTFTLTNISGLSLPDPPAGTYEWFLDSAEFFLFILNTGDEINGTLDNPIFLGIWQAPLAGEGSFHLGNFYVPEFNLSYMGYSLTLGGYTVQNATFYWTFIKEISGNLVIPPQPGDPIIRAIFRFSADNLADTINKDLTYLDNLLGGANGFIVGSGEASFKVSAVPEPATLLLVGAGLLLVGVIRRSLP